MAEGVRDTSIPLPYDTVQANLVVPVQTLLRQESNSSLSKGSHVVPNVLAILSDLISSPAVERSRGRGHTHGDDGVRDLYLQS